MHESIYYFYVIITTYWVLYLFDKTTCTFTLFVFILIIFQILFQITVVHYFKIFWKDLSANKNWVSIACLRIYCAEVSFKTSSFYRLFQLRPYFSSQSLMFSILNFALPSSSILLKISFRWNTAFESLSKREKNAVFS